MQANAAGGRILEVEEQFDWIAERMQGMSFSAQGIGTISGNA
jgi:hypothetical protein